jgi:type 1 glutamine amidotransferase
VNSDDRNHLHRLVLSALVVALLVGCQPPEITIEENPVVPGDARRAKVVFLAGPDSHLPGAHEHKAGSELLATALRARDPSIATVNVYGGWPTDESVFEDADAIVMYCDGGDSHLVMDNLATFNQLVRAGVGVVAIHYCVEVPRDSAASTAMLDAIGGYFETWWSVNPIWTAEYDAIPPHPVTAGLSSFTLEDEWYFNMRFLDEGVAPLLSAIPPASTMRRWNGPHSGNDAVRRQVADKKPQVTAWAYERPGGGRGMGYTGGHYHANWDNEQARAVILNAIEWVAQRP